MNYPFKEKFLKIFVLFLTGGFLYTLIEICWRGYTHWTMAVLSGLLFLFLGGINNYLDWEMPLFIQVLVGAAAITVVELFSGIVLNIWLGLDIWDYSDMAFNILGQVCPQYSAAWVALSMVGIVLDDYLRYWIWHEDKPHYRLLLWGNSF